MTNKVHYSFLQLNKDRNSYVLLVSVKHQVLHQNAKRIHIQLLVSAMTCNRWIGYESLKGCNIDVADQVIVFQESAPSPHDLAM